MSAAFLPIVHAKVQESGIVAVVETLHDAAAKLPLVGASMAASFEFDLSSYVTTRALDGLFHVVGEKEVGIRSSKVGRLTPVMQEVFAAVDKH